MKKQFIAGAKCPECGKMDKLQRVDDGESVTIVCVSCGMEKPLDAPPPSATELAVDALAQPVTLMPPPSKGSKNPEKE